MPPVAAIPLAVLVARPLGPDPVPVVHPVDEPGPSLALPVVYPLPLAEPFPRRAVRAVDWLLGAATLFLGLAVLTAVPVGQFLVLGYLLEAGGRVARTGRLRDGFVGVRKAARLGGVAAGVVALWLPLWVLSSVASSAAVVAPGSAAAHGWNNALLALTVLYVVHVTAACLRGGRLRHFASPLSVVWLLRRARRGGFYREARDGVWNTVVALRLPYYFWLGLRGFAGAFVWLAVPVALLGAGHVAPVAGLGGAGLLGLVVLYLPFLQTRFARDNRIRAFVQLRAVRADFRRAPLVFALALAVQLAAAVPLYLLKIEVIPRDLIFLEGLVFLAFTFPARLLTGWALARGGSDRPPRHWAWRWAGRVLPLPVVAAYVFVVFTSQHLGWKGVAALYEQHAFLLPVPFAGGEE